MRNTVAFDSEKCTNVALFRIFYDIDESIKLAKELESTGISAIAIHGRTPKSLPNSIVDVGEYYKFDVFLRIFL